MELSINKPIAFIDLETTGINVASDRIVEISIIKINPDGEMEILTKRVNPTVPIPAETTAIHGISDKDIKDEPTFAELAPSLVRFIGNADLGGYNSIKFDFPLLVEEFLRVEVEFDLKGRRLIDVQNIFHKMEPRNLAAAYRFYCKKTLENAHTAEADAMATYEILKSQLDVYAETEYEDKDGNVTTPVKNDMDALAKFSSQTRNADLIGQIIYNSDNVEVFNFGKHKGKSVSEMFRKEPQYYDWMMKSKFARSTKKVITAIYLRGFNKESVNIK